MAQCKQSPQEFIKNAFTPQIAVLCSQLAEAHCEKNNLSFIELLQPFTRLGNDVHYRDPTGSMITIRNMKLTFLNVNLKPPQTAVARKCLNLSVSQISDFRPDNVVANGYSLNLTQSTPWFEAWRDTFLRVQYPSDHEYTKHFLSCMLVVSSAELNVKEDFIKLIQSLNEMQGNAPGKLPKWFSSNILKYFVIIHDNVDGNIEVASDAYDAIRSAYGETNCFLLRLNSRPLNPVNTDHLADPWTQFINNTIESADLKVTPESSPFSSRASFDNSDVENTSDNYHPLSPSNEELSLNSNAEKDPIIVKPIRPTAHGLCLSTDDVEQVKLFLHEYTKRCLLPYIEKQMQQLNDVISNKKGVSRSLFSATKRWFNPNKPGASSIAVNHLMWYAPDAPELQIRRLGDLYFMFGHYSSAFHAYHLAKRDYNTDQAWLYYAGALEMAALSAFMANEANRKTCDYMEESITTYLNTCKMPQFATRATLLSSECLKSRNMYGEAAHQLIRMTSEESDLRSALFLEQAAYCFLHSKMIRKYAFHMVLAGHRFSKAAQRRHSLRSYKQAHQVYESSGWDLAKDHIHYTIGRQAHNLHSFDEAVVSFAKLLKGDSKQSAQQQNVFLKEYLTILGNKLLKDNDEKIPILVLPELDNKSLKLLMGPTLPLSTPGKIPAIGVNFNDEESNDATVRWNKLEEILVQEVQGSIPLIFKPMISLYNIHNWSKNSPLAIVNEPIQVCIDVINSLQIVLQLKDISLLWSFEENDLVISNEDCSDSENYVKTHITKSVLIQANCNQKVLLSITPLKTGILQLEGICYTLASTATPTDNIAIKGKQLFEIDRAEIKVVPLAPCLQVTFSEIHSDLLCDEVQKVDIDFHNTGTLALHNVYIATPSPHLLCSSETQKTVYNNRLPSGQLTTAMRDKLIRRNHITSVSLPNGVLNPNQQTRLSVFLKAPEKPGSCAIEVLIYYENINVQFMPRYRLVRHRWNLSVQESLQLETAIQPSHNSKSVEEIALVLKATNLNKTHSSTLTEITLLNVGLFSNYWNFMGNAIAPKYINLHSQESAHIFLKMLRQTDTDKTYSSMQFHSEGKDSSLNSAYMAFAKKTELCQMNLFSDMDTNNVDDGHDGVVLIQWKALVNDTNRRIVDGQSQIAIKVHKLPDDSEIDEFANGFDDATLIEVGINRDKIEEKQAPFQPKITYNLIFPPMIEHNFQRDKVCVIPIALHLHSIIQDSDLNVIINTINGPNLRSDLFSPYASKHFSWLGNVSAVTEMKPLSTKTVILSAVVSQPGTFDLGTQLEILCNRMEQPEDPELQSCHIESALIVIDGKR